MKKWLLRYYISVGEGQWSLEENRGEKLCHIGLEMDFLAATPKTWIIKEKTDKLYFFNEVLKLFILHKILKRIKTSHSLAESSYILQTW